MVTKKKNIHAVSITSNPEIQICGLISFVHFVIMKTLKISEQSQLVVSENEFCNYQIFNFLASKLKISKFHKKCTIF